MSVTRNAFFPCLSYIFTTGLLTKRMPVNEIMRRFKLVNN